MSRSRDALCEELREAKAACDELQARAIKAEEEVSRSRDALNDNSVEAVGVVGNALGCGVE
eukprot:3547822-Prorocentrum_lima.AAC.1